MKKILITGGSGLLGQYLNLAASAKFKIHTTYKNNNGNCKNFTNSKVDILKEDEIKKIFGEFKPDIVIHTAAITNPVPKENQTAKEYFEFGVVKYENYDFKGSISDFDNAIDKDIRNAEAYYFRGLAKYGLDDYEGAIVDFKKAVYYKPDHADPVNMRPKPFMKIIQNGLGNHLHTSYRNGNCNFSCNEITDYHCIDSTHDTP